MVETWNYLRGCKELAEAVFSTINHVVEALGKAVSMARTEVHTVICSLRHQLGISYLTRLKHVVRPGVSYFQYEKEAMFSFSSVSKARA